MRAKLFGSNGERVTLYVTIEQVFETKTYHESFEEAELYIKNMVIQGMGMKSYPLQINVPQQTLVHMFNTMSVDKSAQHMI